MNTEFKPMIYGAEPCVLAQGIYEGREFLILSLGTHPTAYVSCDDFHLNDYTDMYVRYSTAFEPGVEVHGDFTFLGRPDGYEGEHQMLGWDYNHLGDYNPEFPLWFGITRYSTEEIFDEVKSVIRQLNKLLEENENA